MLLLPDPFRGMGASRKTMEPQKLSNSPGPGPEVVKRQRIAKERAAQRIRSWTAQNEIRGILGRVTTDVADSIIDSANPREIRTVGCVRYSEDERDHSKRDEGAQVPRWNWR